MKKYFQFLSTVVLCVVLQACVAVDSPEPNSPASYILTPKPPAWPRINGPKIYGVRPGRPFLYLIAATGDRPMTFDAKGLPEGLVLDFNTGIITGAVNKQGEYPVVLEAKNSLGRAERMFRIVVGDRITLTPPIGWNTYYGFRMSVSEQLIRQQAEAMIRSGLAQHGWNYINIDDGWSRKPGSDNPQFAGPVRQADGTISVNGRFSDMKKLCDDLHAMGLKVGLYSSPGPLTCGHYAASYQYEVQDAKTFAQWGFDYLKYDWCSYKEVAVTDDLQTAVTTYELMGRALEQSGRDIVFSLCQYGQAKPWEWGPSVGGHCWRTTRDIIDNWKTVSSYGFGQEGLEKYAGPGHWNDPDMLMVGVMAKNTPSRLTPDEQYTHVSLWCLLCSPLLIGGDLCKLDDFTLGLLTNDEVLEVNQDPLGRQAALVKRDKTRQVEIWAKQMEDGSMAVGLFNRSELLQPVEIDLSDLGLQGRHTVRDLWRQKDLGVLEDHFEIPVRPHGVVLIRIAAKR